MKSKEVIEKLENIVKQAGELICGVYEGENFYIEKKSDDSPVTQADTLSQAVIIEGIKNFSSYPIIDEESYVSKHSLTELETFWAVDPLDGTKDFISRNSEFTINIALIVKGSPEIAIMYLPVYHIAYWAIKGEGAYKNNQSIYNSSRRVELIGTASRFHSGDREKEFFLKNNIHDFISIGSALKLCKLAEGIVDVYPRFQGSKIWDIAAGQLIATEAGCKLIDQETKKTMTYTSTKIENHYFIASRSDLHFI